MGYPTSIANHILTWNKSGTLNQWDQTTYEYNIENQLIQKVGNGITTNYYAINHKIHQINIGTNILKFFYALDKLVYFTYNGTRYFYVFNAQNDITHLVDDTGNIVASYIYDAWGNHQVLDASGIENTSADFIGNINPYRYRGYLYDTETQLYWVSSRYYSPELCRWISPDSIEYLDPESINGLNLYAYCGNDPINKYDPTGHFGIWALVAITAASMLIGGTAQLVSNAMAGKTGSELWRGVAGAAVGAGVNALALCLAMPTGGASLFIAAGASAIAQTGVDTLETVIRGEEVDVGQTFIDLGLNFVTTLTGNYLGGKMIPTNPGWIQTQKFWSVFTKPYGQKILLQTAIGAGLSGTVNFIRKNDWSKYKPIIPMPVLPLYPLF